MTVKSNDTVIFSSSPIPGNGLSINKIIDQLSRKGATIIHHKLRNIHTSGHGAQEELKLMLLLLKPKFFVPIHGEYRMLKKHTELANECGVPLERTFLLDNGDILELNKETAAKSGSIPANPVYVDGKGIGDIGTVVLRDRRILSQSSIVLIILCIDVQNSVILSGPKVITRGFVYIRESTDLLNNLSKLVESTINHVIQDGNVPIFELKRTIVDLVQSYIYKEMKRNPMIYPIIMTI